MAETVFTVGAGTATARDNLCCGIGGRRGDCRRLDPRVTERRTPFPACRERVNERDERVDHGLVARLRAAQP